ncbi:MAG: mevalonate kinase [Thermofilum sp.]|nr:mevalonate kinase [Thermofilum sp.]
MAQFTSSAPGKVILFGEHFVVEGQPAIAVAVSVRAYVSVEPIERDEIQVYSKNYNLAETYILRNRESWSGRMLPVAVAAYTTMLEAGRKTGLKIDIDSQIPPSSGMGSSAAVSVATVHATSLALGLELELKKISDIAYEAEKVVHGKPSGIDNTIAAFGGAIAYRKGEGFVQLKPVFRGVKLVLADTGKPRNTGEMVRKVLALKNTYPSILDPIYYSAGKLVVEAAQLLEQGEYEKLGNLMNINHGLLSAIGVSTKEIETLVHTARESGALGAKLTGAGGGGYIVALCRENDTEKVINALKNHATNILTVNLEQTGVRKENI